MVHAENDQTRFPAEIHWTNQSSPRLEIIPPDPLNSFRVLTHDFPSEICGWAAHPEYEIHLITKTQGTYIVGDGVGTFSPGHVSLVGPDLPHNWVSDIPAGETAVNRDVVIHFTEEWIRACIALIPELRDLDSLLARSRRGILFSGQTAWKAADRIISVANTTGPDRVAHMFRLLGYMARAPLDERSPIASEWMGHPAEVGFQSSVRASISYIFENLSSEVRLSTAAGLAYMSEPTFSKYFKRCTGLTFSSMVKRLRVAHARRLLDSTDLPVSSIATKCGYKNISNFNRQFLEEVQMTPSQYRMLEVSQKPPSEIISMGLRAPSS